MLEPESRHLLTDALRPPDGFSVEIALATTYTLDLTTVLLAPLAMAAYDQRDAAAVDGSTPLALLESIRRHAGHTTVLCQAAGIHVPPGYPKLAAFAEGCVVEIAPPPGRTFHPKIWLLRFRDADGRQLHRFVTLSRNLTGDKSWDTILICDEDDAAPYALDAQPVSTFVQELLVSSVRPIDPGRRAQILDLCDSLRSARLALPEPFTDGRVIALGTPSASSWPLPSRADRCAIISPFLDVTTVARLPQTPGNNIVLSRPETLDRLGSAALAGREPRVLQPLAEATHSDETGPAAIVGSDVTRGLHAKVFIWEAEGRAHLLTGSANCTGAAFGGNVELSVLLSGAASACGVKALLGDDTTGFLRLTQPHSCAMVEPQEDPLHAAERSIESWHAALSGGHPKLVVTDSPNGFDLHLEISLPPDPDGLAARTTVRPVGAKSTPARALVDKPAWRGLSLAGLTPYLAVSTTIDVLGQAVTRECVLVAEVVGAPPDRLAQLLRDLLARQEDVLRYLALLLGDPTVDDLLDRLHQHEAADPDDVQSPSWSGLSFDDLVLLEPLVRAAARGDEAINRAHRLLEDLRDPNGDLPQLSEEFLDLWGVVWEASKQ